jgi:rhodanese-related sulfurtransferase
MLNWEVDLLICYQKIIIMKENQLFNGSLIFFLVIVGGLVISLFNDQSKGFSKTNAGVLREMNGNGIMMNYLEFMEQYNPGDAPITYVDLRSEERFQEGHLNNALHMPVSNLFAKESLKTLSHAEGELILYSDSQNSSVNAVMMLKTLGFEHVRALAGSYDLLAEKILENPDPVFFFHNDEKARWNYRNYMESALNPSDEGASSQPLPVIEGGC